MCKVKKTIVMNKVNGFLGYLLGSFWVLLFFSLKYNIYDILHLVY